MMQYSKDIINKIKDINIKKYIDSATSIGFKEKGSIYILLPTDCCWLDEDRIITSVNNEFKPDNIRKLNTGIRGSDRVATVYCKADVNLLQIIKVKEKNTYSL